MVNLNELESYDLETLKTLLQDWKKFTQKVVNDLNDLRDENLNLRAEIKELHELRADFERVQNERDQARRKVCNITEMTTPNDDCYVLLTPKQIAEHYGWDCFECLK